MSSLVKYPEKIVAKLAIRLPRTQTMLHILYSTMIDDARPKE